jgi:hypothetical protein
MNGTAFDLLEQPVKERFADQIARQIKKLIFSKNIEVGQKLPMERDLAGILNVSRVEVREALFLRWYFDTKATWYLQSHLACDEEDPLAVLAGTVEPCGEDIWIADYGSGEKGMIHSPDFGRTWRQETLHNPDPDLSFGPMAVSIVTPQAVWAATRPAANIYRTMDGGDAWHLDAPNISGPNDLDDICAPSADMVWAVQNHSGESGGDIIHVRLEDGKVVSHIMDPTHHYQYEGVTCFDENTAWVVGFKAHGVSADLPEGVILYTADGGANWTNQTMPVNDVALWKVSFVGAHR